jgi:hypothetical protein
VEWKRFDFVSGISHYRTGSDLLNERYRYYLARILENVGITSNYTKNVINLGNTCWGFINATGLALTVTKFPRRKAYLIGTTSLLVVFTAWTIASARYAITGDKASSAAVIA